MSATVTFPLSVRDRSVWCVLNVSSTFIDDELLCLGLHWRLPVSKIALNDRNVATSGWHEVKGEFGVAVGASSRDIKLRGKFSTGA